MNNIKNIVSKFKTVHNEVLHLVTYAVPQFKEENI